MLFGAIAELAQGNKLNLLFQDGEVLYAHGNEYVYNPEDYRLVYMNFARL